MIKKRLPYLIIGLLLIIQFFQIEKTNPPIKAGADFLETENPPSEIASLIKNACYDCHSHHTEFPWYTNIQPLGWWIRGHYRGARMNVNFSEWTDYSPEDQKHAMKESAKEVVGKDMPLKSYTWMHADAKLSDNDRKILADWFDSKSR